VTLGTPHRGGTHVVKLIGPLRYVGIYPAPRGGGSTGQLQPGSEFFRRINSSRYRVSNLKKVDFLAVWSVIDEAILPVWNGYFAQGRNKVYVTKGHIFMILSHQVYRLVKDELLRKPKVRGRAESEKAEGRIRRRHRHTSPCCRHPRAFVGPLHSQTCHPVSARCARSE